MRRLIAIGVTALAAVAVCWGVAHAGPAYTIPSNCTFTAADGGTPRTCASKHAERVTPQDFNVNAGNGSTNATTAIQSAIAVGAVFFPCGTYLTSQLTISASNVSLIGESRRCVTLKANAASTTGLINITSGPLTNIVIREIKFDANSKTGTLNAYQSGSAPVFPAINLGVFNTGTDVTGLTLENCDFSGFDQGIYVPFNAATLLHASFILNNTFTGTSPSSQKDHIGIRINADTTLVQGNHVSGWTNGINLVNAATTNRVLANYVLMPASGNDVGIYASSAPQTVIADNYIELNSTSAATADGCIKLGAASSTLASAAAVHHNVCLNGIIKISNAADSTIDHNEIYNALSIGCGQAICVTSEATNPRLKISDNIIKAPAGSCIQSLSTDATSITGNVCDAPGGTGIDLRTGTAAWVIGNNRIREATNQCIFVDGATEGTIQGNACRHSATGASPGIRVGNSSTKVVVSGNSVAGHARCIQLDTGTNADNVVGLNGCYGTTTAGVFADGSVTSGFVGWNYVNGGIADTVSLSALPTARNMTTLYSTTQAALATPANGTIVYCSDCTVANPCAGAGGGALAKRIGGAWVCN